MEVEDIGIQWEDIYTSCHNIHIQEKKASHVDCFTNSATALRHIGVQIVLSTLIQQIKADNC